MLLGELAASLSVDPGPGWRGTEARLRFTLAA